jgi:DNA-binding NarL/FixJ family response regulator
MYALEAGGRLLQCIIIVDQDALSDEGLVQLRIRASISTGLRVLVVVREATLEYLTSLLRMGFSGFLQCDSSVDTVRKAIERVTAGELWADRKLIADALRGSLSLVNDRRFTRREIEILRKIAVGHNNHRIADDLFITRETVRWHLRSAYSKLGIHDRQVAAGILPQLVAPNAPVNTTSFRVMREESQVPAAIVQILYRAAANAPLGTGAFRVDGNQTEELGRALLQMTDQLRQQGS